MTSRLQARLLAQRALFQRLQSSKKRNKLQGGFTLIELLIVVVIIGILAAIAIPNFLNQRERAYLAQAKSFSSAEARKCGASIAATGAATDFTADTAPTFPAGSTVSTNAPVTCAAGAAFTASGLSETHTWTVTSAGGVVKS